MNRALCLAQGFPDWKVRMHHLGSLLNAHRDSRVWDGPERLHFQQVSRCFLYSRTMLHWSQQTLLTCSQKGHITSAHMRIKGSHIALPVFKVAEIVIHYLSQEEQKWNIHEQPQ